MSENQRVKELRKLLKLNQEEFANSIGIQQGSLSDLERGKIGISSEVLKSLIRVYRINPIWLYDGEGEMILKLDLSNRDNKNKAGIENQEILEKSNKIEDDEYHKSYHNQYHKEYILEKEQHIDKVEEQQAEYQDRALKHSKSEYFEFLKKEIAFKNKIIETLLQTAMIKEEDIEAKVRKALRKNEDKPLITIVSKVEKEVLKTAKTKEEEKLIADIFVRILTRLSEED